MKPNYIKRLLIVQAIILSQILFSLSVSAQLSVAVASDPSQVCSNQPVQLSAVVTGGSGSYIYSWVGTPGNFTSTQQNPVDAPDQTTVYTLTVSDGFQVSVAHVTVDVIPFPTGDAGVDKTICESSFSILLNGSAQNYSSVTWQCINGDGGYFLSTNSVNATYMLSESEKETGYLQFKLYTYAQPPCNIQIYDVDEVIYTIAQFPTVEAGDNAEVCEGETYTLNQATAQDYSIIQWSTSGSGYFSNDLLINPIYTPSETDYDIGSVTLTLSASALSPCPGTETDNIILSFIQAPESNAGTDDELCEDDNIQLLGQASNYDQLLWTSTGNGNFQNSTSLNAIYIPSSQDIANGEVTLTLTASGNGPCADDANDDVTFIIRTQPSVNAGIDGSACETGAFTLSGTATDYNIVEWSTTGDGNFSILNDLETTYTPGINDINNEFVQIVLRATATSPCSYTVYDTLDLIVQHIAQVEAGDDQIVCTNIPAEMEATIINQSSILWTTSGDGVFTSPTNETTIYIPGTIDIEMGSATLTVTGVSTSPCEEEISDNLVITYIAGPIASAGEDDEVCDNTDYTLSGQSLGTTASVLWESSGDGTFSNEIFPASSYLPGEQDKINGSVVLSLTAFSDGCGEHTDDVTLTFQAGPELAIISTDTSLCEETTMQLIASSVNYGSLDWNTNGDGSFDETDILNPVYTFGSEDIASGQVRIIASGFAILPCQVPARDTIYLYYYNEPTASVGNDTLVCTETTLELNGTATNASSTYWFIQDGTGEVDNPLILNTFYTFSDMDIANGEVTLKLVAYGLGDCEIAADTMVITVQGAPWTYAGVDTTVCENSSIEFTAISLNSNGQGWGSTGDGVFTASDELTTSYTPGPNDIANGEVSIFISAWAQMPCNEPFFDTVNIDILPPPSVEAGDQIDVCTSQLVITDPILEDFASILWTSPGDGSFDDPTLINATYTPGETDITNGVVWLTVTAQPLSPCTEEVTDDLIVTFKQAASFDLGENIDTTYNSQVSFSPLITGGSGVYSYQWTPSNMLLDPTIFYATTVNLTQSLGAVHKLFLTVTDEVSGCETIDSVMIGLELGPVLANIIATPPFVCEGGSTMLDANPSGGSGIYVYNWTSIPAGFTASTETLTVSPDENISYVVLVNDGFTSDYDTIDISIQPTPNPLTIQGDISVESNGNEEYFVTHHDNWIYEWGVVNGAVTTGQYSSEVVINWGEPGSGQVWVIPTNQYGCEGPKSSIDATIASSNIDISEIDEIENLVVYPNPFQDRFSIDYELNSEADVSIEIYNSIGQIIYKVDELNKSKGNHRETIDTQMLNDYTGIIIVKLNINNQYTISKLVRLNN